MNLKNDNLQSYLMKLKKLNISSKKIKLQKTIEKNLDLKHQYAPYKIKQMEI